MAPLPPESTPRYFVDYTANGRPHTMQFRYASPVDGPPPETPFIARVATVLADLAEFLPSDFNVLGARYAVQGSNVTLPTAAPASPTGLQTPRPAEAPAFIGIPGRTATGRRYRFYVLGVGVSPAAVGAGTANYRLTAAESSDIAAVIANLAGAPFVGIDGEPISYKSYANLGYNGYWQRAVRE